MSAQDNGQTRFRSHFRIRYVVNDPEIDSTYLDNADRLDDIRHFLQIVGEDSLTHISGVRFCGTASPEGSYEFNVWLSENRLRTFKEFVHRYIDLPDSLIRANESDIAWSGFREMVEASDLPWRAEILSVVDETPTLQPWFRDRHNHLRTIDHRLLKLRRMHGGEVWRAIKSPILRDLRYGDAVFEFSRQQSPLPKLSVPDALLPGIRLSELPPPFRSAGFRIPILRPTSSAWPC